MPRKPPTGVNGSVPPARQPNAALRPREHLFEHEIEKLIAAARKRGRYGHRDATMILLAFRHGLRVSELCATRWDQLDLDRAEFLVVRRKGGSNVPHSLRGDELRALRRLKAEQTAPSPFPFLTERGAPMTPAGFRTLFARIGAAAGFPFPIHPHMLRHGCGYALQNGDEPLPLRVTQAWLGHRDIRHTERYTALAPHAFRDVWRKKG